MRQLIHSIIGVIFLFASGLSPADTIQPSQANNGNLIMEDVPQIPAAIVSDLSRFQNVRSVSFRDWTNDSSGVYVSTRFGDVNQIHRVDMAGGARRQITFYKEPIGSVTRQPGRFRCH